MSMTMTDEVGDIRVSSSDGTLTGYPAYAKCIWKIKPTNAAGTQINAIQLIFDFVDIHCCGEDYLAVYSGEVENDDNLQIFDQAGVTGVKWPSSFDDVGVTPATVNVDTSNMATPAILVVFKSKVAMTPAKRGFMARYAAVNGPTLLQVFPTLIPVNAYTEVTLEGVYLETVDKCEFVDSGGNHIADLDVTGDNVVVTTDQDTQQTEVKCMLNPTILASVADVDDRHYSIRVSQVNPDAAADNGCAAQTDCSPTDATETDSTYDYVKVYFYSKLFMLVFQV
jgi:hypothetical protein